jgi:hypothetical protein
MIAFTSPNDKLSNDTPHAYINTTTKNPISRFSSVFGRGPRVQLLEFKLLKSPIAHPPCQRVDL